MAASSDGDEQQMTEEQLVPRGSAVWKPTGGIPPLALCMEEKDFNLALVQEKRKVSYTGTTLCHLCLIHP